MNSDDFARIISDNSDDLKGGGFDVRLTLVDGERIDGQPTYTESGDGCEKPQVAREVRTLTLD